MFFPNPPQRTLVGALALALSVGAVTMAGCSGTGNGGEGDPPAEPNANVLGDGKRLSDVLGPADWYDENNADSIDCGVPPDKSTRVSGQTIIAIDEFDETSSGSRGNFYIQDTSVEPKEYSGITVFRPSFAPPDLRLVEGDVVDTTGMFTEFKGPTTSLFPGCATLPEMGGTMVFRFENGPRIPKTIVPAAGGPERFASVASYPEARKWLGMLVRIENVTIVGDGETDKNGRYAAEIRDSGGLAISNELFDISNDGPLLADGTQLASVTGVLTFFFDFRIAPRSADDFEMAAAPEL